MNVLLFDQSWMQPRLPALHMQPECQHDRNILERLVRNYETLGMGRDAATGDLIHVRLPLTPLMQATKWQPPEFLSAGWLCRDRGGWRWHAQRPEWQQGMWCSSEQQHCLGYLKWTPPHGDDVPDKDTLIEIRGEE